MTYDPSYTLVDGIKCFNPEVASAYEDYPRDGFDLTDKNAKSSFWVSSRNRLFKEIVCDHLNSVTKTKFLEIGCGTGDFIQQIVGNKNLEITGSEVYLKGLKYAKKNLPNVDFVQFDVTKGRLKGQFDIVAAFDVIEHIENDTVAITNINQMLRKGGTLIISVPQYMFLWGQLDEIVKHKRRYSKMELVAKLTLNGFDISYSTSFLFVLFPLMLVARMFDKKRVQSQDNDVDLEKRTKFSGMLNWVFDWFMRIDETLIRAGFSLPFGGTLVVVAKKRE
jgi:2-polyprenyl-3-methyl-5-hydroxy-6-metoxy-1,4-benzoquinol methylase